MQKALQTLPPPFAISSPNLLLGRNFFSKPCILKTTFRMQVDKPSWGYIQMYRVRISAYRGLTMASVYSWTELRQLPKCPPSRPGSSIGCGSLYGPSITPIGRNRRTSTVCIGRVAESAIDNIRACRHMIPLSCPGTSTSQVRNRPVGLRPAVAEELPHVADLADQVEIHVGDHDVVFRTLR